MIILDREDINWLYEILQEYKTIRKFKVERQDGFIAVSFDLNEITRSRITKKASDEGQALTM
jgi:F0F1-type ATP synthase delta subunit